jgi:hypothetical protein
LDEPEAPQPKPVLPKPELPKPELPKPELPKPELPKPELPKPELPVPGSKEEKPPAKAAAAPATKPAAAPPKPEPPSLTPLEMLSPIVKAFLEQRLKSGETVTIEVGKDSFTGRIFRLMLHEGWIALEHDDGRRRGFYVITGGKVTSRTGESIVLPGGHAK